MQLKLPKIERMKFDGHLSNRSKFSKFHNDDSILPEDKFEYLRLSTAFKVHDLECYFWSESTVVSAWITNEGPWSVFVENRVKEIRDIRLVKQWNHVPGHKNPADLLSRGCLP
ncbi:hypothetical protein AVEN_239431-1 [Araneus ventricosus]|uniref:Uncharacterized protein n=1 Tax=Araneus ventricosus TaxID=182803 RepID=A0A4Y2X4J8_ARAVE|nr:hypothetical protein AVEN_239431-1 [Araneus ventricosus]